jgi:hypothetical protein
MKTVWKILLLVGISLLAFIGIWMMTMRIRPENGVEAYKKLLRAKGEKLEIAEVLPPPVPPESNGVEVVESAFAALLTLDDWTNLPTTMQMVAPGRAMIGWQQPDVRANDFTNSWANVITAAEASRPARELLIQAAAYPALDFHLDYQKGPEMSLRHLMPLKRSAQKLAAAAVCDLHNGDAASATTNVCALLALVQGERDERTLISQLVRIAMSSIAASASWELLQATNSNDDELTMLQRSWERLGFIEPLEKSLLMERAFTETTLTKMRTDAAEFNRYFGSSGAGGASGTGGSGDWLDSLKDFWGETKSAYAVSMWRASWSYSDELNALQGDQIILEALRAMETNRVFNPAYSNMLTQLAAIGITNEPDDWFLKKLDIPDYRRMFSDGNSSLSVRTTMTAEASKRIVVTAIALKRFQLKHGNFPENLTELTPEFVSSVPLDPVDGKPLRYRRNADGTFLLYSIGEDGVDDGGNPTNAASGSSSLYWLRARDWVWPQPATEAEVQSYYEEQAKKSGN